MSVTASDPNGSNGSTPSGVASIAIYDSKNGGAFTLFTTVTPADPSALFTGQAGNTYGFYSIATDNAGNVQPTPDRSPADRADPVRPVRQLDHGRLAQPAQFQPSRPSTSPSASRSTPAA